MKLKVFAVSAPHWISSGKSRLSVEKFSFDSDAPFSLQNALRDAVDNSINQISEAWINSNLCSFKERNKAVILMNYWEEEKAFFQKKFIELNPDILFVGAMTLSMPGALEIAKYAKKIKGDNVLVVIGGKHVSETFYTDRKSLIQHHVGSPLKLMNENVIPQVFDIAVSGDGEKVITEIGKLVYKLKKNGNPPIDLLSLNIQDLFSSTSGDWLIGYLKNNKIEVARSDSSKKIDYENLAISLGQFSLGNGFEILKTDYTAHAFSDVSRGCGYDCFFCSERASINGKLRLKSEIPVYRLLRQFKEVKTLKQSFYKGKTISLFVEDSIFLAGKPEFIDLFIAENRNHCLKCQFGVQFTIDTFLALGEQRIKNLKSVGLSYVAFGIETDDDEIAASFSKNTSKKVSWYKRTKEVVLMCKSVGLSCGMFLIWGLGETQASRLKFLNQIYRWIKDYQLPIDIGLNVATQHPLQIIENKEIGGYQNYNYIDWGTPKDEIRLPLMTSLFGEASTLYAIKESNLPTIDELIEIEPIVEKIKKTTYNLVNEK